MKARAWGLGLTLLLLLGTTRGAWGFCRATTCDPTDASQSCRSDNKTQCVISGQPLFWSGDCVAFSLQKNAAPRTGIDYDAAKASLERAIAAWAGADCAGHAPSLKLTVSDPVTCDASEYNRDKRNANIVIFREDEWPYPGGEDALGITRVRFDPDENVGELYDADIEINAVAEPLSVGEPTGDQVDLDSLMTHEVGHALGLAHSLNLEATMIAGYQKGSTGLRTLGADDVDGVCRIYPPSRKPSSSSCEPRHGFSELCGADQPASQPPVDPPVADSPGKSSSCDISAGGGSPRRSGVWELLLLGGVGATRWASRRKKARNSRGAGRGSTSVRDSA